MLDEHLVHAVIGGKDLGSGAAEWRLNLRLAGGHGSRLLDLCCSRAIGQPEVVSKTKIHSLEPVSYTHLDVYKRQGKYMLQGNSQTRCSAQNQNRGTVL